MTSRPDVAVYIPSLRGGGAERVALTLVQEFAARGLSVDLVVVRAEGPYLTQVPPAVRLFDLRARRVLTSLPGLVRYLRAHRPRSMLATPDHVNVTALLARRLAAVSTPTVVRVANTMSVGIRNSYNWRASLIPHLVRRTYRQAARVVAVSAGVAADLIEVTGLPGELVQTIYNPVVTQDINDLSNMSLRHPWFEADQPPVVLGVGRLVAQKDFATLIRAFANVRRERKVRLLLLGEGRERQALERLVRELGVSDDVALPGFVDNPFQYMSRAAVFVLSSAWEGLPGSLIQAMACGAPVVSTDCPSGPAEILEQGRWGRLVAVGDVAAMAQAIDASLADVSRPDVRLRAADFGVERAVAAYLQALGVGP